MAGLSLTEAWNETAAFVKREGRLLFPVAFLMVALPRAVLGLLAPAALPGRLPEPGAWLLIAPVAIVLGTIANIAISWLALRPGGSVGEALARGARRVLPLLALFLMLGIALGLVFLVLATIALLLFVPGAGTVPPPPGAMRAILIVLVPMVPLLLYLAARLLAATPVAAAEPGGPFAILARSWALSAGRVGTLLGFIVLAALLAIVISLAVQAVAGLGVIAALGPPRPGNLSLLILLLVGAVVETVVTVCLTTMVARIYAQLAGAPTSGT